MTGVVAIRVAAIPVFVYWTATRLRVTPRKGPKKAPVAILFMAGVFERLLKMRFHLLKIVKRIEKPMIPAITLI